MSERFVPLAAFLRPTPPETPPVPPITERETEPAPADLVQALGAARRFRAALADALDVALLQLLREIAERVLGRELRLAAVDVASVVADALARHAEEPVLTLRAHRDDLEALEGFGLQRIPDRTLRRGDIVLELRSGTIDLRLEARVAAAVAACAA